MRCLVLTLGLVVALLVVAPAGSIPPGRAFLFSSQQGADSQPALERYANPILHQDWSDPDVCRVGDDFYFTASSFNCFPGLPVLHSRDLVHWTQIGAALTDYPGPGWDGPEHDFRTRVQHGNGVWAPAIRYHDGWFYIFCGDPDRGIFMVRTQDPSGEWEPPVWLVREKGFIDPCPLWDEDGRAWLSHACAGSRAGLKSVLFVAPMAADGSRLLGPSRIVYDGHLTQPTIEGTKFYQREGRYYIFAPAGGVATGWQTVLRASAPFGPYEERIVLAADGSAGEDGLSSGAARDGFGPRPVNAPHQGAWVTAPDGSDWFVHFQDKDAYGRIVHLQPMRWGPDGWPVIGDDPDGDGCGAPVSAWDAPAAGRQSAAPRRKGTPSWAECAAQRSASRQASDASADTERRVYVPGAAETGPYGLDWAWQYPAVPAPYWHFALPGGGVRLYSVQQAEGYRNLWDCPNLLQQKFPAESFTVTARLVFRPNPSLKGRGEQAGIVVMGTDYAGLRITDTTEGPVLEWVSCQGADQGAPEEVRRLALLPSTPLPVIHGRESVGVLPVHYPDYQETALYVRLEVGPGDPSDGHGGALSRSRQVIHGADGAGCEDGRSPLLRTVARPEAVCRFYYSLDGRDYNPSGASFTAQPGRWIGAKWGIFCNRYAPKNDAGFLDVSELQVTERIQP